MNYQGHQLAIGSALEGTMPRGVPHGRRPAVGEGNRCLTATRLSLPLSLSLSVCLSLSLSLSLSLLVPASALYPRPSSPRKARLHKTLYTHGERTRRTSVPSRHASHPRLSRRREGEGVHSVQEVPLCHDKYFFDQTCRMSLDRYLRRCCDHNVSDARAP